MFKRIIYMLFSKHREKYIEETELTTFKKMFRQTYTCLWFCGLIPKPYNCTILLLWSIIWTIMITGLVILAYSMWVDVKDEDYSDATRQLTIFFLIIMMFSKFINLVRRRKLFAALMIRFNNDYELHNKTLNEDDMMIVKTYGAWSIWVQSLWCILVFGSGSVFLVGCVSIMTHSLFIGDFKKAMFFYIILPVWDEYKMMFPFYELIFGYELFLDLFLMSLYAGHDTVVPIFTMHVCAQLDIVKNRLMHLFDDDKLHNDLQIQRELCWIVETLQKLYKFAEDINILSTNVHEVMFFVTPILSTSSAYAILSCLKNNEIPYEFTMILISCSVHLFIPSFFSNLMMEKSLAINEAVYNSQWENKLKRGSCATLHMIMLRSQKPLQLYTNFKPINLALFSEACQKTWTFFNLLCASFDG